jgi:hypothetical protein
MELLAFLFFDEGPGSDDGEADRESIRLVGTNAGADAEGPEGAIASGGGTLLGSSWVSVFGTEYGGELRELPSCAELGVGIIVVLSGLLAVAFMDWLCVL